jgi:hypothetical protein
MREFPPKLIFPKQRPCHANLHAGRVTTRSPNLWSVKWIFLYLQRPPLHTTNFCHTLPNIVSANAQYEHSLETLFSQNCDFDHIRFTSSLVSLNANITKSYQSVNAYNYSNANQIVPKQLWPTGSRIQKFAVVTLPSTKTQKRKC